MIGLRQLWHGYLVSFRQPEDMFEAMSAPPDWRRKVVLKCFARTVYFVYPKHPNFKARREDRIL